MLAGLGWVAMEGIAEEDEQDVAAQWLRPADLSPSASGFESGDSDTAGGDSATPWDEWASLSSEAAGSGASSDGWFELEEDGGVLGGQLLYPQVLDTEEVESVPLPQSIAPLAKRQRRQLQQQQQQQQQQQLPPSVDQDPQHPAPTTSSGLVRDAARMPDTQLSSAKAWALLSARTVKCGGSRPNHLCETHTDFGGLVFKEHGRTRRMKGSDSWAASGGPKGNSTEQVNPGVFVKRKYGKLTVHPASGRKSRQVPLCTFNYHEFTVDCDVVVPKVEDSTLESRPASAIDARIFHILPGKRDHQVHQPQSKPQQKQRRPTSSNRGHTIEGLLTLQMDPTANGVRKKVSRPRWMRFDDQNGEEKGSIEMGESGSGVVVRSRSGDFAEWHPILAGEPRCFEEGDVVGFCPPQDFGASTAYRGYYITLNTQNAKQLGLITRRAVVQGSCPAPGSDGTVSRQEWDTVAYVGRVPAKLLGSAKSGDVLIPSGRHDGTVVAVRDDGSQHIRIGKVEHDCTAVHIDFADRADVSSDKADAYELLPLSNSGEATGRADCMSWQLVGCSVVVPSCTVLPQVQMRQRRRVPLRLPGVAVLALLLIAAISLASLTLGRQKVDPKDIHSRDDSENGCKKISLPHGLLRGECDGTPGTTCVYAECDSGYVLREVASQEAVPTDHDGDSSGLDAPPSRQASRPVGGPVWLPMPAGDQSTPSGDIGYRQFIPCTSCFDSDGLMCQPKNRSRYPIPLPAPTWKNTNTDPREHLVPHDPYDCPSDIAALLACEGHINNDAEPTGGDGELCFGPFNGFRPCERCRSTGTTLPPQQQQQQQQQQQHGRAISYEADGLACEATMRGLPWNLRRVFSGELIAGDGVLCTSDPDWGYSPELFSDCMERGYSSSGQPVQRDLKHAVMYSDDRTRVNELCVPLDLQKRWRDHWRRTSSNIKTIVSTGTSARSSSQQVEQWHQQYQSQRQREEQHAGKFGLPLKMFASRSRHCVPGAHGYNGTNMECVRRYRYCPSEQLGALRNGVCRLCAGKEAVLSVPRTPMPNTSSDVTVVDVPCPLGFRGSVRRTCAINGWVDESLVGECARKRCVPLSVSFDDTGNPIWNAEAQYSASRTAFPFAVEGSGLTSVPCPTGYTGNISAVCAPDAEVWSSIRGRCSGPSGAVATGSAQ
eukprot:COSAG02_NODE_13_length_57813_cov_14.298276_15_plen_1164_part_00